MLTDGHDALLHDQNIIFCVFLMWLDPVILWGYHPTLKLSGIPTFTLIVNLRYSMDNTQINLHYIGDRSKCHVVIVQRLFGVWVEILLLTAFFVKISRLHIVCIDALRWTEFHQNRKDPMREIQRFPDLGHNLCENDKQNFTRLYLIKHEIFPFILGIFVTDGSLQVSKKL